MVPEEGIEFAYTKIADYTNGKFILLEPYAESGVDLNELDSNEELGAAIEKLSTYGKENKRVVNARNQVAYIENLEEGVYLIEGSTSQHYQIPPSIVSIPAWQDGDLSYHVSVFPKIQEENESIERVETGDSTQITFLIILCIISLLIVLYLSCVFFRAVLQ